MDWVQSRTRRNMAASPPALPGFGNSGKSFLIDNLLQSRTPSAPPAGGHLRLVACERPRRTWSSEHGALQSQARSPPQVKALGGPLLPHSGGKHTHLKCFIYLFICPLVGQKKCSSHIKRLLFEPSFVQKFRD